MSGDISKGLIEQSGEVLNKAYDDLIQPTAEPVGKMLSYLPRTIRLFLAKWEKWLINGEENIRLTGEALRDKVNTIPEKNLCEPEPYVAIPAIQQIVYCYDSDELRDMYANLLASSMNSDKKWQVHPGFVDIIKQLTPDEAKFLRVFPLSSTSSLPLIDIKVKLAKAKGERMVKRNITIFGAELCEQPDKIGLYIEDLCRLKLIEVPSYVHLIDDSLYNIIINSDVADSIRLSANLGEGESFNYDTKTMHLTEFGLEFVKCCLYEN